MHSLIDSFVSCVILNTIWFSAICNKLFMVD
jgi:hypothetical protein